MNWLRKKLRRLTSKIRWPFGGADPQREILLAEARMIDRKSAAEAQDIVLGARSRRETALLAAKAEAKKVVQEAKGNKWQKFAQAVSDIWITIGRQCRLVLDSVAENRRRKYEHKLDLQNAKARAASAAGPSRIVVFVQELKKFFNSLHDNKLEKLRALEEIAPTMAQAKKVEQEAKAAKWREIGKALRTFFVVLRHELRKTSRQLRAWVKRNGGKVRFVVAAVVLYLAYRYARGWFWFLVALGAIWVAVGIFKSPENRKKIVRVFRLVRLYYLRFRRWSRKHKVFHASKVTWKLGFLLSLLFVALTIFGVIIGNNTLGVWIKAFAPVGAVWAFFLPILTRKGFPALVGKTVILLPTTSWLVAWVILRLQ